MHQLQITNLVPQHQVEKKWKISYLQDQFHLELEIPRIKDKKEE